MSSVAHAFLDVKFDVGEYPHPNPLPRTGEGEDSGPVLEYGAGSLPE